MKFLPKLFHDSYTAQYSGIRELEDYIFNTKDLLDTHLSQICSPDTDNITPKKRKDITQVQHSRHSITIKPADRNLGVVAGAQAGFWRVYVATPTVWEVWLSLRMRKHSHYRKSDRRVCASMHSTVDADWQKCFLLMSAP